MGLLIRRADLAGHPGVVDVRIEGERVVAVAPAIRAAAGDELIDAAGSAVIPGLADHHVHLLAWAAALGSTRCGPPEVTDRPALARALRAAPGTTDGWVRGVGYHESVGGLLDRAAIDDLEPDRPVRIQHRSGMLWMVNSEALRRLGLDDGERPDGLELGADGRPTGRCWQGDRWLRDRLPRQPIDLADVGNRLAEYGVTSVTDATATNDAEAVRALETAVADGRLRQRVTVMGPPDLEVSERRKLRLGPVKIVLREASLPDLGHTAELLAAARSARRHVAFHCTTRVELVFALAVLDHAGAGRGNRIEHGGIVPPELYPRLRADGLTVVTQPNFVAERGDQYLCEVDPSEVPNLYPCASLLRAGIRVAAGTDAPFGNPDPWRAIHAATARTTTNGHVIGADERVDGETALGLFLAPSEQPGGRRRRVALGEPADLCILTRSLRATYAAPAEAQVAVTIVGGELVHVARG